MSFEQTKVEPAGQADNREGEFIRGQEAVPRRATGDEVMRRESAFKHMAARSPRYKVNVKLVKCIHGNFDNDSGKFGSLIVFRLILSDEKQISKIRFSLDFRCQSTARGASEPAGYTDLGIVDYAPTDRSQRHPGAASSRNPVDELDVVRVLLSNSSTTIIWNLKVLPNAAFAPSHDFAVLLKRKSEEIFVAKLSLDMKLRRSLPELTLRQAYKIPEAFDVMFNPHVGKPGDLHTEDLGKVDLGSLVKAPEPEAKPYEPGVAVSRAESEGQQHRPDTGVPKPEGHPQKPEADLPKPEGQLHRPETEVPKPEGHPQEPEAGLPKPEGQLHRPETEVPEPEGHPQEPEAGLPQPEAGPQEPEAGLPQPEAGPQRPDAELLSFLRETVRDRWPVHQPTLRDLSIPTPLSNLCVRATYMPKGKYIVIGMFDKAVSVPREKLVDLSYDDSGESSGDYNSNAATDADADTESGTPLMRSDIPYINLSKRLREEITSLRGYGRFLSLKELCGFSLYQCDLAYDTHIRIPPSSEAKWILQRLYLSYRDKTDEMNTWINFLHDYLNKGKIDPNGREEIGQSGGNYSIELLFGWSITKIAIIALTPVVLSLVIGIYYQLVHHDVATAWIISTYIVAAGAIIIGVLGVATGLGHA